jgi:NADH-quinone oxidoreductase subunit L
MSLASLIVLFPLLGAVIAGLFCRSISARAAELLTSSLLVAAAVMSAIVFKQVGVDGAIIHEPWFDWFTSGPFAVNMGVKVDALTAVMLVVVTSVSAVVHIYSVGYMHEDPHRQRFMAYLSLFTFFMLMLVTADNFVQVFLGWEGVGLCSYLLIGFWFKKPEANAAAMKAFLVNRVGDIGFALGIFAIFVLFGSLEFATVFGKAPELKDATLTVFGTEWHGLTVICLLLFIGCMGKSAQLGLHTWLPDAMEGPTPVSALIHAATMVTAGVFLVARCSSLFELSPDALTVVTVIGATTAIFAATVGLVQNDIKRVIAYSTCSQLGYMFFACGVSAYSAGVFHLMTHAFFKALLFLGAGSVIHGLHHEQDMRFMGGVRKHMPVTYAYMWIGTLALAGIGIAGVGFAGYYSKDLILEAAYAAHHQPAAHYAFWLGLLAAFLTAFYSSRLMFLTFHGESRAKAHDHHAHDHHHDHTPHESPAVMLVPMMLLVLGALFAGAGGKALGMVDGDYAFWNGAVTALESQNSVEWAHHVPGWVPFAPLVLAVFGIALAYAFYVKCPSIPVKIAATFPRIYKFLLNKWYFDELYAFLFVRPAKALGRHLWRFWDVRVVDGLGPNGAAWLQLRLADVTARLQSGYVYHYAFAMLTGLVLFVSIFIVFRSTPGLLAGVLPW